MRTPLLALLLLGPLPASAAEPDVDALDAFLAERAAAGDFVGRVRVEGEGGEVLLARDYGAVPPGARCRIGSVSKPFTAAALHVLHARGALSLDDPITRWVPEVEERLDPPAPTLRDLAVHRGGLSEVVVNPWARPPEDAEAWLGLATLLLRTEAAPGARQRYSNTGYQLLSVAVGRAGGGTYAEVLHETVLAPLGLEDTGLRKGEVELAGHLHTPLGLVASQRALPRLLVHDHRWPVGGDGGLSSAPRDMARLARALRDGTLLPDAVRARLLEPGADGEQAAGWVRTGEGRLWHNGALVPLGIYAYLRWSVEEPTVVALCGTPTISDVDPEWRVAVEAALSGAPRPVQVRTSPFGWLALVSVLRLHQLLALLGVVLAAAAGGPAAVRIGAIGAGAGLAVLGAGLTHPALGLAALAVAVVLGGLRWGLAPPASSGGIGAVLTAVAGVGLVLIGLAGLGLLEAFAWLLERVW